MLTDSQVACVTHNGIIVRVTKSDYHLLAVRHVWELYASLQCAFFTRRAQGQKSKRYFVGQHSLQREGYVVSVEQPSPRLQFRRRLTLSQNYACVTALRMCECVLCVCE